MLHACSVLLEYCVTYFAFAEEDEFICTFLRPFQTLHLYRVKFNSSYKKLKQCSFFCWFALNSTRHKSDVWKDRVFSYLVQATELTKWILWVMYCSDTEKKKFKNIKRRNSPSVGPDRAEKIERHQIECNDFIKTKLQNQIQDKIRI